jgi:hypothetical protein
MNGYFQRLVARAGGAVAPAPSLPPTLPSGPRTAGESDPFQNVVGPEPTADFASRGAPGPMRAEATMTVSGAAEGPEIRVEQSTAPLSAARLTGERLVPQERIERPAIARVDPGNPLAAKLAEPWTDQESARVQAGAAPLGAPARLAPGRTGGEEKHALAPEQRGLDSEPGAWAPGQSFENHLIAAGSVERIIERSRERPLEPPAMAASFASAPPRRDAPRPSSPAAKLAPPAQPEERAEAQAPEEPRLVIGRLQVDVVPAPVPAPATNQVIAQGMPAQRTGGRASNLRFGLGQI